MGVKIYIFGSEESVPEQSISHYSCTVSGKKNVSTVIPRLHGWIYKILRLPPLVVEHSILVMSARLGPMGSQFSIPVL